MPRLSCIPPLLLAALCLTMGTALGTPVTLNADNPVYRNARYGFSLRLPPGKWHAVEADNGDGITALNGVDGDDDRAQVRAYGTLAHAVMEQGFKDVLAEETKRFAKVEATSADPSEGWFTLRGVDEKGQFMYEKCFFSSQASNLVIITVHPQQRPTFDLLVRTVEATFRPGF